MYRYIAKLVEPMMARLGLSEGWKCMETPVYVTTYITLMHVPIGIQIQIYRYICRYISYVYRYTAKLVEPMMSRLEPSEGWKCMVTLIYVPIDIDRQIDRQMQIYRYICRYISYVYRYIAKLVEPMTARLNPSEGWKCMVCNYSYRYRYIDRYVDIYYLCIYIYSETCGADDGSAGTLGRLEVHGNTSICTFVYKYI